MWRRTLGIRQTKQRCGFDWHNREHFGREALQFRGVKIVTQARTNPREWDTLGGGGGGGGGFPGRVPPCPFSPPTSAFGAGTVAFKLRFRRVFLRNAIFLGYETRPALRKLIDHDSPPAGPSARFSGPHSKPAPNSAMTADVVWPPPFAIGDNRPTVFPESATAARIASPMRRSYSSIGHVKVPIGDEFAELNFRPRKGANYGCGKKTAAIFVLVSAPSRPAWNVLAITVEMVLFPTQLLPCASESKSSLP